MTTARALRLKPMDAIFLPRNPSNAESAREADADESQANVLSGHAQDLRLEAAFHQVVRIERQSERHRGHRRAFADEKVQLDRQDHDFAGLKSESAHRREWNFLRIEDRKRLRGFPLRGKLANEDDFGPWFDSRQDSRELERESRTPAVDSREHVVLERRVELVGVTEACREVLEDRKVEIDGGIDVEICQNRLRCGVRSSRLGCHDRRGWHRHERWLRLDVLVELLRERT
jgi:hypothetical protein